ncbi:MAG: M13 family metallopeptidase [Bacteroidales bacterium]|jgi:putative endopeptidase|nr:M13 family metallopeptidase [Bacteroidales bacterium]
MKNNIILAMTCSILLLAGCKGQNKTTLSEAKSELTSGIRTENLDTTVNPANDFYLYACGGWIKNHPLPAEYSRYGSFEQLDQSNLDRLKELVVEIAAKNQEKGTIPQKIAILYSLGMDIVTIEKQGAQPIQADLKTIAGLKEKAQLTDMLVKMHTSGTSPFFSLFPAADPDNSAMNIAWLWQSGLGIGDRDYYLEKDKQPVREKYVEFMTKLFALSGYSKMVGMEGKEANLAAQVMKLETAMAQIFMKKEATRDVHLIHNIKTIADFQKMFPAINVNHYLKGLGVQIETLNISQLNYFTKLNDVLSRTDFNIIKAYLAWNIMNDAANYLSSDFVTANFDFYGKTLSGRQEDKPRWKKVISTVDGCLGEAVGQMYAEKYFPKEAKDRMLALVKNVQSAMADRIKSNTWMQDSTKTKALDKLNAIKVKIGYPDKWRNYDALAIENDSYFANIVRASKFESAYQLNKIGKPVDQTLWQMTPQTVNAYYEPTINEICFPAGILQPPFFDMNADDAVNYGAIGVVIAHELTHGFDDQGSQYDKNGNLAQWWTEQDAATFKQRTQVLVDYFNSIEVLPGVHANGQFTLGENIADNGGVNVAYDAMQKAIAAGTVKPEMDKFSAAQRFFIAFAGVWANSIRDEEIIRRTKSDPHSLGKWRVNATLAHVNTFYQAYGVKEGDKMYVAPDKRVMIW